MAPQAVAQPQGPLQIDLIPRLLYRQGAAGQGFGRDVHLKGPAPDRRHREAGPGHGHGLPQSQFRHRKRRRHGQTQTLRQPPHFGYLPHPFHKSGKHGFLWVSSFGFRVFSFRITDSFSDFRFGFSVFTFSKQFLMNRGSPIKQEKAGGTGFHPVRDTGKMPMPPKTFWNSPYLCKNFSV
jgi:hypothetical protein